MKPKAVLFDLDGVLIDTMPLHARAWQAAFRRVGRSVDRALIYACEGEPGHLTVQRLLKNAPNGHLPADSAKKILRDKEALFAASARAITVKPGWQRSLRWLQSRLPLALVTGTSRREVDRVVPKETLARFTVIITGDAVRRGKPHPEPYLTACRRLGVRPRDAIVIENAPYGIESARSAGAGYILALASSLPSSYLQAADEICLTPSALRKRLQESVIGSMRREHAGKR